MKDKKTKTRGSDGNLETYAIRRLQESPLKVNPHPKDCVCSHCQSKVSLGPEVRIGAS